MSYQVDIGTNKLRVSPSLPDIVNSVLISELSYNPTDSYYMSSNLPWSDGTIRMWNEKKQMCPAGLLSRVIEILSRFDLTFVVRDLRDWEDFDNTRFVKQNDQLIFRPYQLQAIELAKEEKSGVIGLPTGAGKTMTAAGLLSEIGCTPMIFYVPKKDLMYQTVEAFHSFFKIPIGMLGDSQCDLQDITVATVQTASNAIKDKTNQALLDWLVEARLIFFDESHHVAAQSIQELCKFHKHAVYRFGTSATPFREDGEEMKIEGALGRTIIRIPPCELIDQGYLVPPKIYFYKCYPDTSKLSYNTYASIYKYQVVEHHARNAQVISLLEKIMEWKKTCLTVVNQVRHGELLMEMSKSVGVDSYFIQGSLDSKTRGELIEGLRAKQIGSVICTSQIGSEGLDVPSLDSLINAGAGKSVIQTLQRVGRTLRNFTEPETGIVKTNAYVFDFLDQVKYLKTHSNKRLKTYKSEYGSERVFLVDSKK